MDSQQPSGTSAAQKKTKAETKKENKTEREKHKGKEKEKRKQKGKEKGKDKEIEKKQKKRKIEDTQTERHKGNKEGKEKQRTIADKQDAASHRKHKEKQNKKGVDHDKRDHARRKRKDHKTDTAPEKMSESSARRHKSGKKDKGKKTTSRKELIRKKKQDKNKDTKKSPDKPNVGKSNRRYVKDLRKKIADAKSKGEPEVPMPTKIIKVGSDCSGYGSDIVALTLLGLQVDVVFCSELCPMKRELLAACHKSCGVPWNLCYHDIVRRDNASAPYVDVFFTGAPCQAYSGVGQRRALGDPRGVVIMYSMDYVREKRPRVVIIENVRGIIQGSLRMEIWEPIRTMLLDLGYVVHAEVIDTRKHGIPHSRPRFYVVAVRQSAVAVPFKFPTPIPTAPLSQFLDLDNVGDKSEQPQGTLFQLAIKKALEKHGNKIMQEELVMVDVASSETYSNSMVNSCPCLTKARAGTTFV
jgi:DNA-cytosine methyltransferase